jgi:hypothetical protein
MKEADFEQSGETAVFADYGDSGNPVLRHFCRRCGSPISVRTTLAPGHIVVKAGTLDDIKGLQPRREIFADHAVEWLQPVEGAKRFEQNE